MIVTTRETVVAVSRPSIKTRGLYSIQLKISAVEAVIRFFFFGQNLKLQQ